MRASLVAVLAGSLVSGTALADVIPDDVYVCQDKKLGDSCSVEHAPEPYKGTCQDGEYCHLVYGTCDSGGGPCGTACSPALACKAGEEDSGGCGLAPSGGALATSALSLLLGLFVLLRLRRGPPGD